VSRTVHVFDISDDPLEPRQLGVVEVGAQPFDPIFSADGRTVWLGNKMANTITAIDAPGAAEAGPRQVRCGVDEPDFLGVLGEVVRVSAIVGPDRE